MPENLTVDDVMELDGNNPKESQLLFEIVKSNKSRELSLAAVSQITFQKYLEWIAQNHVDDDIKCAAIPKLSNWNILKEISANQSEAQIVKSTANKRLAEIKAKHSNVPKDEF